MQLREILDLEAMLSKGPTPEQVEGAEAEAGDDISEKTAGPSFKEEEEPEEVARPTRRTRTAWSSGARRGRPRRRKRTTPFPSPRWKRR
jgi:hypothetical protein